MRALPLYSFHMLDQIARHILQRHQRRLIRAAARLYPDPVDRANGLLCEGAQLIALECFNEGNPLRRVVITPGDDHNYCIQIVHIHDVEEPTDVE